jgi:hypothetical protein
MEARQHMESGTRQEPIPPAMMLMRSKRPRARPVPKQGKQAVCAARPGLAGL